MSAAIAYECINVLCIKCAYMIGHYVLTCEGNNNMIAEGRGSIHFFLKSRGWVTSISAGVSDEGMHRSSIAYIFGMSIHLTDSGLEKVIFFPTI